MKTRIRSFIMAMLLVLSMATSTLAAGAGSVADFRLYAEQRADRITLSVYLTATNATNGRIEIEYDNEYVKLVDVVADDNFISDVNSSVAGEVKFAWVGSKLLTSNNVLTLVFQVVSEESVEVAFVGKLTELYSNDVDMIGENTITSIATIEIDEDVLPDEPTPTPPAPVDPTPGPGPSDPVDPTPGGDDDDEDEDKPGINIDAPELTTGRYNAILIKYPDAKGHWAEENIVKAINAGLFNGTGANTFSPDGVVTRGMFVTLLYRLCGEPAVDGALIFTDVASTQYYANAVAWAYSNGVVNGVSATEFAPDQQVTREQMVTMLYRFAKFIGDDLDAVDALNGFGDTAKVSSWAEEAMNWAVANGIINGSNGNLNPGDVSTRAQIATVLVRYAGL